MSSLFCHEEVDVRFRRSIKVYALEKFAFHNFNITAHIFIVFVSVIRNENDDRCFSDVVYAFFYYPF